MKMMKAACLTAVVAILVLSLAACGSPTTSITDDPVTSTAPSTVSTAATTAPLPPTTQSTTPATAASVADIVVFNDPVLEKGIRAALNKPTGDITFAEATTLKELELSIEFESPEEMRIKDLSGLEHFVNLEQLGLQFHWLSDISPLSGLTHLKALGLGGNSIRDITPLAGLRELDFLSIFNCEATDYTPLQNLTSLRVLFIGLSKISDLTVLSGMKGL
ncbi:MAG: hypothetical protein LLG45_04785, partial [Actinomycetia bacterium]|nr:hypothetical protein [Actinomycetes bacterium]